MLPSLSRQLIAPARRQTLIDQQFSFPDLVLTPLRLSTQPLALRPIIIETFSFLAHLSYGALRLAAPGFIDCAALAWKQIGLGPAQEELGNLEYPLPCLTSTIIIRRLQLLTWNDHGPEPSWLSNAAQSWLSCPFAGQSATVSLLFKSDAFFSPVKCSLSAFL